MAHGGVSTVTEIQKLKEVLHGFKLLVRNSLLDARGSAILNTIVIPLLLIYIFVIGLHVGSFINVVALRYGTGLSFTRGRSVCFSCGMPLHWYDMVPVFSFLCLDGKCRRCHSHISWQYPIVELTSGLLFLGIALRQMALWPLYSGFSHGLLYSILFFIFYAFVFSLLLVICIYDIRHKIIPDAVVYSFIILSIIKLLLFIFCLSSAGLPIILTNILDLTAPFILAVPFWLIWLISDGKWIGFGDIKLMFGIGALLGLALGMSAIILAFWIGAVWGLTSIVLQKRRARRGYADRRTSWSMNSELPFAPFLILGTVIVFFWHIDVLGISQFLTLIR